MTGTRISRCSSDSDSFFETVLKTNKNRVIDRSLLTRKQHETLLAIPRPIPPPPPMPKRKVKRCNIPKICPPRIDQLAVPTPIYTKGVLQLYHCVLEPIRVIRLVKLVHQDPNQRPKYTRKKPKKINKKKLKKMKQEECYKIWLKGRISVTTKAIVNYVKRHENEVTPNYRQLLVALGIMRNLKIKKKKLTMKYTKQYIMRICEVLAIAVDAECQPYRRPLEPLPAPPSEIGEPEEGKHVFWIIREPPEDESEEEEEGKGEEEGEEEGEFEGEEEEMEMEGLEEEGDMHVPGMEPQYLGEGEGFESDGEAGELSRIIEDEEDAEGEDGGLAADALDAGAYPYDYDETGEGGEGGAPGDFGLDGEPIPGEGGPGAEGGAFDDGAPGAEGGAGAEDGAPGAEDGAPGAEGGAELGEDGAPLAEGTPEEIAAAAEAAAAAGEGADATGVEGDIPVGEGEPPIVGGEAGGLGPDAIRDVAAEMEAERQRGEGGYPDFITQEMLEEGVEEEEWMYEEGEEEGEGVPGAPGVPGKPSAVIAGVPGYPGVPEGTAIVDVHPPHTVSYLSWKVYLSWLEEFGSNIQNYGKCLRGFKEIIEAKNQNYSDKIHTILTNWGTYLKDTMEFEKQISEYFKGKTITKCPKCGDYTLYNIPADHEIPPELKTAAESTQKWTRLLEEASRICKSFYTDDVSTFSHETIEITDPATIESSETSMYFFEDLNYDKS